MSDQNVSRGRVNRRQGQVGESIAKVQLRLLGVRMLEDIHNHWLLTRWVDRAKMIAQVTPATKVAGDLTGVLPGGRRVLAEVKDFDGDTLVYSRLKTHQHYYLSENAALGALSLIVWVRYGQPLVIEYSKLAGLGYGPGKSITLDMATAAEWKGV